MAISPDNAEIYVASGISGTEVIPLNATNTDLLPAFGNIMIAVKSPDGTALSAAVDPSNRLF